MGGLIMTHSDDLGLVLPPKLAPIQVVIIPIHRTDEQLDAISEKCNGMMKELRQRGISVKFDNRTTYKPGWKFAEYELKGVPLRIAMGPRDLENGTLEIARRDTLEKQSIQQSDAVDYIEKTLEEIQESLFKKAFDYRTEHTTEVNTFDEFKKVIKEKGGYVSAHWDGTAETEDRIKELTKATIRCIPINNKLEDGTCILTGNPSKQRVLFAKSY
jgi:prolyl-tRNA synthetase